MRRFPLGTLAAAAAAALSLGCGERPLGPAATAGGALAAATASLPAAPSNATANESSPGRMDVRWRDNSGNETGFEVHRSAPGDTGSLALRATTGANVTAYVDVGLATGTKYCYAIRAVKVTGSKSSYSPFSSPACATTATPPPPTPAAPSNLVATASSETQVNLGWQDNSGDEGGFQIERSDAGADGPFALLATTAANTVGYADHAVVASHGYCYRVRSMGVATSPSGTLYSYSSYSSTVCVTTPAPPPPPPPPATSAYSVSVKPLGSTYVELKIVWTDATSPAPAYGIQRSTNDGASWETVNLYVDYFRGNAWDYPLASEQRVCYRTVLATASGDGAASPAGCTTPPAGPWILGATAVDAQTLELTWRDNSAVEDGYEVWLSYYRPTMGCYNGTGAVDTGTLEGEELVATLPANSTSYRVPQRVDNLCIPATTYSYYIVATKDGGRSDPSDAVSASAPVGASATTLGAAAPRPLRLGTPAVRRATRRP